MEKVAILTTFREFVPGYSLTGIVFDQFKLLTRAGHEVDIFVCEDYHGKRTPPGFEPMMERVQKKIPKAALKDYKSPKDMSDVHKSVLERMAGLCLARLKDYDMVMTHDFIFTGWNVPYGQGILQASQELTKDGPRWLHWIHSIPSGMRDYWYLRGYGNKHKIVYPNKTDIRRVAEQFKTETEQIRVIPHPKDLRSWMDFGPLTCQFLDDYPGVMQADIVQIYPCSTDRLSAKRLDTVILTFANMKKMGWTVSLVVANQWATGRQRKEDVAKYRKLASRNGLTSEEVAITSEWQNGKWAQGIPKEVLRELFMCSNLFLFPTREETFGLVLPEAVLSGGVLPVLNKSLQMMMEVSGMNADFIDFGAFNAAVPTQKGFEEAVALAIIGRLTRNESIMCKTYMRQRYNWDNLYQKFYRPIFAESVNW